MWPLYPLSCEIIGVTITSSYISCSWVQQVASDYMFKAYIKKSHEDYEVVQGALYNSSKIKKTLQQFLHTYNLHNAYAVLAIENMQGKNPSSFLTMPGTEIIMQYQLLAISIPLNCIMIVPHNTVAHTTEHSYTLSNSCAIAKDEALYNIDLYMLGKKL